MPHVDPPDWAIQAHYIHNRAGGGYTALRVDPRGDLPVRDGTNHRVVLPSQHRLHPDRVSEEESDNDFVFVSVAQAGALYQGFVARRHLVYLDLSRSPWPYRHLADQDWWISPWVFGRDSCRAMVLHSTDDVNPNSVCGVQLTAEQAAKYFCSG